MYKFQAFCVIGLCIIIIIVVVVIDDDIVDVVIRVSETIMFPSAAANALFAS